MRIAVFQFASSDDIELNFSKIKKAIFEAAENEVRLLVFHECALCGYPSVESKIDKIDFNLMERHVQEIQHLAKENPLYIAVGILRKINEKIYNSVVVINPQGGIMGFYDKRALWGWDWDNFSKGEGLGVFEVDNLKIGFRICYEIRFPEYFRELFKENANLCFVCFCDVSKEDLSERYELIKAHLKTRAVENVMTVISANSISSCQTAPTAVFDINGKVVAEAPKNTEHLLIYDYETPEIGFGQEGRIQNSKALMKEMGKSLC